VAPVPDAVELPLAMVVLGAQARTQMVLRVQKQLPLSVFPFLVQLLTRLGLVVPAHPTATLQAAGAAEGGVEVEVERRQATSPGGVGNFLQVAVAVGHHTPRTPVVYSMLRRLSVALLAMLHLGGAMQHGKHLNTPLQQQVCPRVSKFKMPP
jgi:hypothetical protein